MFASVAHAMGTAGAGQAGGADALIAVCSSYRHARHLLLPAHPSPAETRQAA